MDISYWYVSVAGGIVWVGGAGWTFFISGWG